MSEDEFLNFWLEKLHVRLENIANQEADAAYLAHYTGIITPPTQGSLDPERMRIIQKIDEILDVLERYHLDRSSTKTLNSLA